MTSLMNSLTLSGITITSITVAPKDMLLSHNIYTVYAVNYQWAGLNGEMSLNSIENTISKQIHLTYTYMKGFLVKS